LLENGASFFSRSLDGAPVVCRYVDKYSYNDLQSIINSLASFTID